VVRALLQHAPGDPSATICVGCRDLEKGRELVKLLMMSTARAVDSRQKLCSWMLQARLQSPKEWQPSSPAQVI